MAYGGHVMDMLMGHICYITPGSVGRPLSAAGHCCMNSEISFDHAVRRNAKECGSRRKAQCFPTLSMFRSLRHAYVPCDCDKH